jgi:transposase
LERYLVPHAKVDDPVTFGPLRTVPGIGPILGLILLYEIDDIRRFPEAGNFLSYTRLVRCQHSSAGKVTGSGPEKMGNAHRPVAPPARTGSLTVPHVHAPRPNNVPRSATA